MGAEDKRFFQLLVVFARIRRDPGSPDFENKVDKNQKRIYNENTKALDRF